MPSVAVGEPPSDVPTETAPSVTLAVGVARSSLWSVGGQLAIFAATFAATPFTIRLLGPAAYGVWALLQSVLAYFILADLGMATASTKFAAESHAHNDDAGEAMVICSAVAVTAALTGIVAIAASLAAPTLISHVLHVKGALRADSIVAFRLVCVAAVALAVANSVNTPQQVRLQWGSLTIATQGPIVLRAALAPLVLLATAGGLVALGVLIAATSVATAGLNLLLAVRLQRRLLRPRFAMPVLRRLIAYGGWLAVAWFAMIPLSTAERFFLAHYHSTKTVAYYAVAASLGSLLTVVAVAVTAPLVPALSALGARDRFEERYRLYHQALRGLFLVATPAALVLAFLARPFLGAWAGRLYGIHSAVPFYILIGGLWLNTLSYLPSSQLLASGRASTLAVVCVAQLPLYLLAAAFLTSALGAVGAAVVWSGRAAVSAVVLFAIVRRRDGLPWIPTPRRAKGSLAALACTGGALLCLSVTTSSLGARAAWSLVVIGLYGALSWNVILTVTERQALVNLLTGLGRRYRGTNAARY